MAIAEVLLVLVSRLTVRQDQKELLTELKDRSRKEPLQVNVRQGLLRVKRLLNTGTVIKDLHQITALQGHKSVMKDQKHIHLQVIANPGQVQNM